ncbi:MAG TPA: YtzI protein [Bacillus bacterium]|nr:YtzI protein [Siminovitchia fordii]HBZ12063.1 YtzI protein [Bacillus sp. (in: firmicutes)]
MKLVMVISIIMCIIVVLVTALVTSKAYSVKHTIDPMPTDDNENHPSKENKIS